jgi:MYXO-CTERM domain-containing protein
MKFRVRLGGFAVHALCAAGMLAPLLTCPGVANAAIVTNTYSTTNFPSGPSNPDGASYPPGTPAVVSIKFDDAVTYIGGADTTVRTTVNIPAGLSLTIGADVFTADTYYIDYYNAGPGRSSADVTFRTGFFPFSLLPVLHNGVPTAGLFPVQMQFSFYGVSTFTPMPIAPGLSFPLPPYVGEGFVRDANNGSEYLFPQGSWSQVPTPGAAAMLGLSGLFASRRRRA